MNVLQINWSRRQSVRSHLQERGVITQHYSFIKIILEHLIHFARQLTNPDPDEFSLQSGASRWESILQELLHYCLVCNRLAGQLLMEVKHRMEKRGVYSWYEFNHFNIASTTSHCNTSPSWEYFSAERSLASINALPLPGSKSSTGLPYMT